MRSHPYTTPPPLPRTIADLASILPFPKKTYRSLDDSDVPLSAFDPDTSELLPPRPRRHHVWVQGKLAEVKSLSTANLPRTRDTQPASPGSPREWRTGAGASSRDRERIDDGACSADEYEHPARGDLQPRGYGIGGAGNIRRPTDVIHGPTRLSNSRKNYTQRDLSPLRADGHKQRFSLRDFLNRRTDRKGKAREI